MTDGEFAANVRQLTGKETNGEALAVLRGGAPALQNAQIEADATAVKAKLSEVKDRVSLYLSDRWAELRKGKTAEDAIVVVDEAFAEDDDETPEDSTLAAPTE